MTPGCHAVNDGGSATRCHRSIVVHRQAGTRDAPPSAAQVHVCDGIKYVQDSPEGHYDIIVVDSSDPVGPAEVLFQKVRHGRQTGGGHGGVGAQTQGRQWPAGRPAAAALAALMPLARQKHCERARLCGDS